MSLNIELLRTLVSWAEKEDQMPEDKRRWDQGEWARGAATKRRRKNPDSGETDLVEVSVSCGTTFCLAGNACHLAGDKFVVPEYEAHFGESVDVTEVLTAEGDLRGIEGRATDLLGIKGYEARELFDGSNDIDDVREIAASIARRYGHALQEA